MCEIMFMYVRGFLKKQAVSLVFLVFLAVILFSHTPFRGYPLPQTSYFLFDSVCLLRSPVSTCSSFVVAVFISFYCCNVYNCRVLFGDFSISWAIYFNIAQFF